MSEEEESDFNITGEILDGIIEGTVDTDEIIRKLDRATRLQYEKEREQEQKHVNDHKKPSQVTLLDFMYPEVRGSE